MGEIGNPGTDPWRAAQARRQARGEPGLTAPDPRPPEDAPSGATGPADWYEGSWSAAPAPPGAPPDGRPGLPPPGPPPSWQPPPGEWQPGPGMAAPGRYGWGRSGATYVPTVSDKGATTSLVLSIVSLFICGIFLGPAAIVEGVKARKRIRASGGGLTGDGMALAGIIIGSIATVVAVVSLVLIVATASGSGGR